MHQRPIRGAWLCVRFPCTFLSTSFHLTVQAHGGRIHEALTGELCHMAHDRGDDSIHEPKIVTTYMNRSVRLNICGTRQVC